MVPHTAVGEIVNRHVFIVRIMSGSLPRLPLYESVANWAFTFMSFDDIFVLKATLKVRSS